MALEAKESALPMGWRRRCGCYAGLPTIAWSRRVPLVNDPAEPKIHFESLATLRLRLIKIAGRVRQLLTKVRIHLASGHPGQRLWKALERRLLTFP